MILFVFEGSREDIIFQSLSQCFFHQEDERIVCVFQADLMTLWYKLKENGEDFFRLLKERLSKRGDHSIDQYSEWEFSEIFLFFDYDFHNTGISLDELNLRTREMLKFFSEETNEGKLYINYPMVESIKYLKSLTDPDYYSYTISRHDCLRFKQLATDFSFDSGYRSITVRRNTEEEWNRVQNNWLLLINLNVSKANFLCNGQLSIPDDKSLISQGKLFDVQLNRFVTVSDSVSVLNSFPLFLFDYFV